ncbi:MAG TPA: hypothetical protein VD886_00105 [Herpetosiphonaceae bacterium]|nr:hypothetical protein [Herpetosiphonaceae bacterium]
MNRRHARIGLVLFGIFLSFVSDLPKTGWGFAPSGFIGDTPRTMTTVGFIGDVPGTGLTVVGFIGDVPRTGG